MKAQIIIPVYKPDGRFLLSLERIKEQTVKIPVLIIDSGSDKRYTEKIKNMDCSVADISAKDFDHGGTRQAGADMFPDRDIYIFMTQDAVFADETAAENIINAFKNERVGCAYGRQLPHKSAGLFASHARLFNYPDKSYVRTAGDKEKYGIKTAFMSNSFAAYRRTALKDAGGFPTDTILSEDMYIAAKMLLKGWSIAYCAEAKVYHSHDYALWQEFKRYFDIGAFHAREAWIRAEFGAAEGEGKRFAVSEAKYLIKKNPFLLIEMIARSGAKFIGYRLGLKEEYIPAAVKRKISMNFRYWK